MKRWFFATVALAGLLALAACAAKEEAKPAPATPMPAAATPKPAAATPKPAAKPAWEQEWERVLAAAKQEGKVVMGGPTGARERRALTESFTRKYGIAVDYLGVAGPEFPTRLRSERAAGQYLWDLILTGTTTIITALKPMGAVERAEPALILPDVKDPKNWREGRLWYGDKDKLTIAFTPQTRPSLFINTNLVKADQFKSYKDLLDPQWKGKIAVGRDPRVGGPGQATFTLFYRHKDLGPDFIRALAKQELRVYRQDNEAAQALAQGAFPILLGVADRFVINLAKEGLPVEVVDPRKTKEGGDISPANGVVALLDKHPHPNAAKVYINWLLSKDAQLDFSKATGRPSWRADVPIDHLHPWVLPQPGYVESANEEAMAAKEPLVALLKDLLGE